MTAKRVPVHMNGRVFDPRIGRFVSPDPIVGNWTDGQSFNRYSYVRNSPLSFTDPSGYTLWNVGKSAYNGAAAGALASRFLGMPVPEGIVLGGLAGAGFGVGVNIRSWMDGVDYGDIIFNGNERGKQALLRAEAAAAATAAKLAAVKRAEAEKAEEEKRERREKDAAEDKANRERN